MRDQQRLYLYNRVGFHAPSVGSEEMLAIERRWIDARLAELSDDLGPTNLPELRARLERLIAQECECRPPSARYVAEQMSLEEFRLLVHEFAVDGLTEAQSFYYVLPRLTLEAQMPMLRIMIDEFGSGNLKRAHTSLYVRLLQELEMPTDVAAFIDHICAECFEFVNLFFWLAVRADDASYFAGAITYLETSIPSFFGCYVDACSRLSIESHAYYSEHCHIDTFHAVEGQRLLRAMHTANELECRKAWLGARLASSITAHAFEAAVRKARLGRLPGHTREASDVV